MTTWYTAPIPHGGQPVWAFTVRPDLWPAGSVVDVVNTDVGWLANWDPWTAKTRPGPESLAGQVSVDMRWDRTHWHWTEVPAP